MFQISVLNVQPILQEYSEWKKDSVDVCLPGIYIGLIDRLTTFSHIVKESTQALCDLLLSTYHVQLNELCKSGKCKRHRLSYDFSRMIFPLNDTFI